MLSSFNEFSRRISYIREKINAIRIENQLAATPIDAAGDNLSQDITNILAFYKKSRTRKKQFDYTLIIIAAYGAFEYFLESVVEEFILILSDIVPKFSQLPESIKSNHMTLSFDSIKNLRSSDRFQIESNTIKNLHSCYSSDEKYKLNASSFSYHTSNFRTETISEVFSRIGLRNLCKLVTQDPEYKTFAENKHGIVEIEQAQTKEIFQYIEDLAERRNEVAHGDFPQNLLTIDELEKLIDSLEMFVRCATRATQKYTATWFNNFSEELGNPLICHGKHIACFNLTPKCTLYDGQPIIATNDGEVIQIGQIIEMQIDNNFVGSLSAIENVNIGLHISGPAKAQYSYYVVSQGNERVRAALADLPASMLRSP